MNSKLFIITFYLGFYFYSQAQEEKIKHIKIDASSSPASSEVKLTFIHRIQSLRTKTGNSHDQYDASINSPKSVLILDAKKKFYVHSLEGHTTSVYDLNSFQKLKVISHTFTKKDTTLFLGAKNYFTYTFRTKKENINIFSGKPVESCLTHNGKYLWVTYYRRDYDKNAIDPSALAIIDTDEDKIVRIMPTGPLPKMIAASPDGKYVAITHWGDNTVGLIDITGDDYKSFHYIKNIVIGYRKKLDYKTNEKINRDENCGFCLRGTVFTPDSSYLFIGKMGGDGIAVIDLKKQNYTGTIQGMKNNIRHIIIKDNYVYLSINKEGYVQRTSYKALIDFYSSTEGKKPYTKWENVNTGKGCRTICSTTNGTYIFAAVNNDSKVVVIRTKDMKVISSIDVDSFPVGMAIDESGNHLIVTAQGKPRQGGGNSVMIFSINYKN